MEGHEFRPMDVGQILDRTFRLYRDNFVRFIAIVALVQVPVALLSIGLNAAVTLTVARGDEIDQSSQLLTVDGEPIESPALALHCPDALSFSPRPAHVLDVYGVRPRTIPHTLSFLARKSRPRPSAITVHLRNVGGGTLSPAVVAMAVGPDPAWLTLRMVGSGKRRAIRVSADARDLAPGAYDAVVEVDCPGAVSH